ncbi:MAG: amidohydrolase [Clostridia bacterium]|nr:amidohydrolase [Clostridia bacterium]
MMQEIIELRRQLHRIPELSHRETKTKAVLMEFLRTHTSLPVTDRGSWFYAYYDCGNPEAEAVAFRADFDALPIPEPDTLPHHSTHPGRSHTCGHDGHSAALAGFACLLEAEKPDRHVYCIFQHAEEVGGGGEACAELIQEKNISRVYAFHNMSGWPENCILVRSGITHCASKGLTIRYVGKTAHASTPEDGINPSCAAAELTLAVREISAGTFDTMVLATIVNISVGSKNFGISAADGEISMTLRSESDADMCRLEKEILEKAESLAAKYGLYMTSEEQDVFPATVNDPLETKRIRCAAAASGLACRELPDPYRASEDFGYYLRRCPGAMFYIGNGEAWPPIHTVGYDFNDRILPAAVRMFWKLLTAPTEEKG